MTIPQFTHLDVDGNANMVDVGGKQVSVRTAVAGGRIRFTQHVYDSIRANQGQTKKGAITDIARIAGIMAAKRTSDLIPLCHPLPLDKVGLDFRYDDEHCAIVVTATAKVTHKTGVEMEALTAVSVACLTIYDMCKALSQQMTIEAIQLVTKTGGKQDIGGL